MKHQKPVETCEIRQGKKMDLTVNHLISIKTLVLRSHYF